MMIARGRTGLGGGKKGGVQFSCLVDEVERIRHEREATGFLLLDLDPELLTKCVTERRILTACKAMGGI